MRVNAKYLRRFQSENEIGFAISSVCGGARLKIDPTQTIFSLVALSHDSTRSTASDEYINLMEFQSVHYGAPKIPSRSFFASVAALLLPIIFPRAPQPVGY